jgi:hypothetical protein
MKTNILRTVLVLFFVGVVICAIGLAMLRLFGVLFFLDDTPLWAAVPALVSLILVCFCFSSYRPSLVLCFGLLIAYILSMYFYVWGDLVWRFSASGIRLLDVIEIVVISLLFIRCFSLAVKGQQAKSFQSGA